MNTQPLDAPLQLLADPSRAEGPDDVPAAIRTLDTFLESNRSDLPAELRHYLERRSYGKALAFIQGQTGIARGSCAPKDH